ncbi:CBS domain-containing protein [Maribius pontilimi]|uniref:CBS domain-containing protein n=1 Tax=Palleronia pontilimi TaxID=1964209 RepID=A0A934I8Q9_9RHOB|nr:CBS domain-containing protein [Palleronia pontilimi]MBJ3762534.1 CBS domain-containing protein [Palleronia pontilimi]
MFLNQPESAGVQVRKVMSSPIISAAPDTTVRKASALMQEFAVGAIVVTERNRPVGIATDRDIIVRVIARGKDAGQAPLRDAMSPNPISCFADQDVSDAAAMMGNRQIKRVLVVDRSDRLVGLLSLGDIAENVSEVLAGQALGEISEARAPCRRSFPVRPPE